jgi:DUF1680 family protein
MLRQGEALLDSANVGRYKERMRIVTALALLTSVTSVTSMTSALPAIASTPPKPRLESFNYSDVQVTGGPMAAQAKATRNYYLALSEDSLLQGFRLRAGLPAPGKPMGGWYDPDDFAGAHSFGQYVSALSRYYANTGDRSFKDKVARLVHGFHETMGPDGFFYSSAKVAKNWPCYVYDKNAAGMRDAYTYTGNKEALVVLSKMTDWVEANLPLRSDEWYTLAQGFYLSYALTNETRYLKLAAQYDYSQEFFDLFADDVNAFTPDRHAYSHVNSLTSAAQTYESTGDEKYLHAVENAWKFLTETQMYASGGWGPNEHFITPGQGALAASVQTSMNSFETPCGSYANVNLDRYLLRFNAKSKYGDNMERVLLNGMLSALPMGPGGRTFYYSNYTPGARKGYRADLWTCCSGTYAQITADYPLDIYFHDDEGLYVNLFAESKVKWKFGSDDVSLIQKTTYPLSDEAQMTVHLSTPETFALHVRVPAWLKKDATLKLNGRPVDVETRPGKFLVLKREWHDGDVLDVIFPKSLRFEPIDPQTPDRAALMYGPLLLPALSLTDVLLHGDSSNPSLWIKPVRGTASDFVATDGTLFRPIYLIQSEAYTTYPKISSE